MPGPGSGQVADRVENGEWREGRRSDEPRLTGATQPQQQQQQQQHNSSSRHNSNNNNKDFYCPNKRQTKDSLAALPTALPAASAGEHSRIAIFIILFAYKRSHISASVSHTHTHTRTHQAQLVSANLAVALLYLPPPPPSLYRAKFVYSLSLHKFEAK